MSTAERVHLSVVLRGLAEEGKTPREIADDVAALLRVRYGHDESDVHAVLIESSIVGIDDFDAPE